MLMPNPVFSVVLFLLPILSSPMSEVEPQLTSATPNRLQRVGSQAHPAPDNGEYFHRGSGRCEALQCV